MRISEELQQSLYVRVWSGFYSPLEVAEAILATLREEHELFAEDDSPLDEERIRKAVQVEFHRKLAAEQSWPKHTDCDRLDHVFATLHTQGILALHHAGYTQSDGLDEISQHVTEAEGAHSALRGYCFYHGQDLERAVQGAGLWLSFGAVDGTDAGSIAIGHFIQHALRQEGFLVEWDGRMQHRICISNMEWKKRSP